MQIRRRCRPHDVALETTLLAHGVPREAAPALLDDLRAAVREGSGGASEGVAVGVVGGVPTVGITADELSGFLAGEPPIKVNTSNLSLAVHRGLDAATTVSTTMELAAGAGLRVFATGGIGGVHRGYGSRLDISSDLTALTRFPITVVASGVKSILDVVSTREALETLGVPVVGFRTDSFPAFYLRGSDAGVDARFDDASDLAAFVRLHTNRSNTGVLIANPIQEDAEIAESDWSSWLAEAEARAGDADGRDATPAVLAALHEVSDGATLRANIALAISNARLAGAISGATA
ncbi:MAG: pseudouridine-5'-phosphate glycosidase [Planctomycetota bacterium]